MRIKEYLTDELLMIANNVTGEYSDKQIRQAKLELYNRGVNDEVIADIMEEKEEAFMKRLDAAARAEEAQINKRNEKNRNISYQWWEMLIMFAFAPFYLLNRYYFPSEFFSKLKLRFSFLSALCLLMTALPAFVSQLSGCMSSLLLNCT